MTMPGLPKVPSAEEIYLDENGQIERGCSDPIRLITLPAAGIAPPSYT